jgi:arylsulfatase A-like enzyme
MRFTHCAVLALLALVPTLARAADAAPPPAHRPPNIVFILADDLGYNDIGCFGSPHIKTPNIDRLAKDGTRFTDFYAPAPVCTPTRAALMTGCYPPRVGLSLIEKEKPNGDDAHVLYWVSRHGLNPSEVTLPELLKQRGYATAMIGKWHLGDAPEFLPTRQGFDSYFGVPYSNDMPPFVLLRDEKVVTKPYDQATLIEQYTSEAIKVLEARAAEPQKPFFLYFAHNAPHTPLHAGEQFKGKSERGLYGDVVQSLDWSVGQVLDTLDRLRLSDNTIVVFTSDNGPWLWRGEAGGSAFPLRGGKGTTYEGGMREPTIVRWPGKVPAGATCKEVLSDLDWMPTFVTLAGGSVPTDRIIDGRDITAILTGQPGAKNPHDYFLYYANGNLHAIRSGRWKFKLETTLQDETEYGRYENPGAKIPEALYDLETDVGEQKNLLADGKNALPEHKAVADRLRQLAVAAREDLGDHRLGIKGKGVRPIGDLGYDRRKPKAATNTTAANEP